MQQTVSEEITRKSASNLALAFVMLPREKRAAMSALYAYCREVDDVADEDAIPVDARREQLAQWRAQTEAACQNQPVTLPVIRELQPAISSFGLQWEHFHELLLGVEADLERDRYETYADLEEYCYRVASAVGLLSIQIFGFRNRKSVDYAIALGKALQFTNILRDIGNDAERGRIYLPLEALREFGVSQEQILRGEYSPQFFQLADSFAARARAYFREARELLPIEDRRSMIAANLMGVVYWRLLQRLEKQGYRVLGPRPTKLSKLHKISLILGTWARHMVGMNTSRYGD
jgi:phytoene synthase